MKPRLTFQLVRVGDKTSVYSVITADGLDLGTISWWSHWRRYAFFPGAHTMWDASCLREIIAFVDGLMADRKAKAVAV